jgi:hypothetical protein
MYLDTMKILIHFFLKAIKISFLLIISYIAISIFDILIFKRCTIDNRIKIIEGNKIILKIDHFIDKHHRLPDEHSLIDMAEVGINIEDESGPFYYQKSTDNRNFIVHFGYILGESIIFSSETRQWNAIEDCRGTWF